MRGRGLHLFGMPDRHDASIRPAHAKVPATLPAHQQQPRVTVVDDVVHQHAERLRDAQTHRPLQPQRQLMHRAEMRRDPSALRKCERTGLAGRRLRAGSRRIRGRRHQPLRRVKARRNDSRRPREPQDPSQRPQRIREHRMRQTHRLQSIVARTHSSTGVRTRSASKTQQPRMHHEMKYVTSPIVSVCGANHGWT